MKASKSSPQLYSSQLWQLLAFSAACADASRMAPNFDFQDERAASISSLLISKPLYEAYCKSLLSIREQREEKPSACDRAIDSQKALRKHYEKQLGILRDPGREAGIMTDASPAMMPIETFSQSASA